MNEFSLPGLFRTAKLVSELSECKVHVGAVLCNKKRPISVGYNCNKSHPKYSTELKRTIHAEVSAIIHSGRDTLEGSTIFVFRSTHDGIPAMSRPCSECLKVLKAYGVTTMYYSTNSYPYFEVEKV